MEKEIAFKVDVDTERGTREGVIPLVNLFKRLNIPATFYFSLGPDNTGRALRRVFKKGFFKKCVKTNVLEMYGLKTLGNGVLWPGPKISKKHSELMAKVEEAGFDVGIHAYDHQRWQNDLQKMSGGEFLDEFEKAVKVFYQVFKHLPETAAAPGWQADERVLKVYEYFNLEYVSDCRGKAPFYPIYSGGKQSRLLEIPTTLPTLDELLITTKDVSALTSKYLLSMENFNVLTLHAEIEGMKYISWFESFLEKLIMENFSFIRLKFLKKRPYCLGSLDWISFPNRAGKLAGQLS